MTAPDPRLDEIQARLDAATPGPWKWEAADATIVALRGVFHESHLLFQPHDDHMDQYGYPSKDCTADAEFIAAAPADVAFLLAELRKAHEALAQVDLALDAMDAGVAIRSGDPRTKSHTATLIRAAVAAANGDGRG